MDQAAFDFDLKLTDEERAVYGLLRNGRARALSVRDLAERTGMGDVQIRQTVRSLIMERGLVIASAVDDPPGFFLAETPDEIINATRSLRHRGIMILVRAARLQKSSLEMVFNQGRLELESEQRESA
ncbi:MAG: hypothetical protein LLG97_19545 [Deltaproteobacteria bacterium]|nr:hypothetical protein [Deltaproteobacteria bacterium]